MGQGERETQLASRHLLASAYTAFDKAGRALGVDAAQLAEQIDLAACVEFALLHLSIALVNPSDYPARSREKLKRAVGGLTVSVEGHELPI